MEEKADLSLNETNLEMLGYGFFITVRNLVEIQAKQQNMTVQSYVKRKKAFLLNTRPNEDIIKCLLGTTTRDLQRIKWFESEEIMTGIVHRNTGDPVVFVGFFTPICITIKRHDAVFSSIDRQKISKLTDELGFASYECQDYLMPYINNYISQVDEEEIQEISKEKLL